MTRGYLKEDHGAIQEFNYDLSFPQKPLPCIHHPSGFSQHLVRFSVTFCPLLSKLVLTPESLNFPQTYCSRAVFTVTGRLALSLFFFMWESKQIFIITRLQLDLFHLLNSLTKNKRLSVTPRRCRQNQHQIEFISKTSPWIIFYFWYCWF